MLYDYGSYVSCRYVILLLLKQHRGHSMCCSLLSYPFFAVFFFCNQVFFLDYGSMILQIWKVMPISVQKWQRHAKYGDSHYQRWNHFQEFQIFRRFCKISYASYTYHNPTKTSLWNKMRTRFATIIKCPLPLVTVPRKVIVWGCGAEKSGIVVGARVDSLDEGDGPHGNGHALLTFARRKHIFRQNLSFLNTFHAGLFIDLPRTRLVVKKLYCSLGRWFDNTSESNDNPTALSTAASISINIV